VRTGSLCTGYGGLDAAVHEVLGGDLAWVADNDPGSSAILAHRLPSVPNLGDITATDWAAVEPVDVLTAGFPCQDVSCAGGRAGLREGNRTGVWAYVARAIGALRPSLVVLENVRGLLSAGADSDLESCPWCLGDSGDESALRALGAVLGDLAGLGFDAEWQVVSAADAGAPHRRERVFILAWPAADADGRRREGCPQLDGSPPPDSADRDSSGQHADGHPAAPGRAPEDPDSTASGERRQPAPGQAESGRPRADARGPDRAGTDREQRFIAQLLATTADADSTGRAARVESQARRREGERASTPVDRARTGDRSTGLRPAPEWGPYRAAIRRWETILGRPAPRPTEPGRTGERLSPRFVEWMQGLPDGWVTDVPGLSRNAMLTALGNGVVPQQAAMALRLLLDRAGRLAATEAA
jgi:DNA (cytosine-5)-methyltransferase 1